MLWVGICSAGPLVAAGLTPVSKIRREALFLGHVAGVRGQGETGPHLFCHPFTWQCGRGKERDQSRLRLAPCHCHHFLLGKASHKASPILKDEAIDPTSGKKLLQSHTTNGADPGRGTELWPFV